MTRLEITSESTVEVTFSKNEIQNIIAEELAAYRNWCNVSGIDYTDSGAAESVWMALRDLDFLSKDDHTVTRCIPVISSASTLIKNGE